MLVLAVLVVGLASALLGSAEAPPRGDAFPASAESAVVAEQLEGFPGSDEAPVLLVATKGGAPLSEADTTGLTRLATDLGAQRAQAQVLSLIHISEPTRRLRGSRMPSSA